MSKTKRIDSSYQKRIKESEKGKAVTIYPMMPRDYTAAQRARLRRFEQELLKGKKVNLG